MCDWQIKKDSLYQPTITVVNKHGDEVAFFEREEDAARCVEAVNSVERLREVLEAAREALPVVRAHIAYPCAEMDALAAALAKED